MTEGILGGYGTPGIPLSQLLFESTQKANRNCFADEATEAKTEEITCPSFRG